MYTSWALRLLMLKRRSRLCIRPSWFYWCWRSFWISPRSLFEPIFARDYALDA